MIQFGEHRQRIEMIQALLEGFLLARGACWATIFTEKRSFPWRVNTRFINLEGKPRFLLAAILHLEYKEVVS